MEVDLFMVIVFYVNWNMLFKLLGDKNWSLVSFVVFIFFFLALPCGVKFVLALALVMRWNSIGGYTFITKMQHDVCCQLSPAEKFKPLTMWYVTIVSTIFCIANFSHATIIVYLFSPFAIVRHKYLVQLLENVIASVNSCFFVCFLPFHRWRTFSLG